MRASSAASTPGEVSRVAARRAEQHLPRGARLRVEGHRLVGVAVRGVDVAELDQRVAEVAGIAVGDRELALARTQRAAAQSPRPQAHAVAARGQQHVAGGDARAVGQQQAVVAQRGDRAPSPRRARRRRARRRPGARPSRGRRRPRRPPRATRPPGRAPGAARRRAARRASSQSARRPAACRRASLACAGVALRRRLGQPQRAGACGARSRASRSTRATAASTAAPARTRPGRRRSSPGGPCRRPSRRRRCAGPRTPPRAGPRATRRARRRSRRCRRRRSRRIAAAWRGQRSCVMRGCRRETDRRAPAAAWTPP